MLKVLILPEATKDILEAAQWYNSKQKGLGKAFINHVRQCVEFIRRNPAASPIRYGNVRTAVLWRFPYMIHYQSTSMKRSSS